MNPFLVNKRPYSCFSVYWVSCSIWRHPCDRWFGILWQPDLKIILLLPCWPIVVGDIARIRNCKGCFIILLQLFFPQSMFTYRWGKIAFSHHLMLRPGFEPTSVRAASLKRNFVSTLYQLSYHDCGLTIVNVISKDQCPYDAKKREKTW